MCLREIKCPFIDTDYINTQTQTHTQPIKPPTESTVRLLLWMV